MVWLQTAPTSGSKRPEIKSSWNIKNERKLLLRPARGPKKMLL